MAALHCQHCDHLLTSAEIQDGWCESCGKRVPAGITSAPSHRDPELLPPRREAPAPARAVRGTNGFLGWGTVRAGLAQVFVGVLLLSVGLGLLLLVTLDTKAAVAARPGTGKQVLQIITILMLAIGGILAAAGMCMGCAAPADPGPRGWALGVAGCVAAALLLFLLQVTFQAENARVDRENFDRELRSSDFSKPRPPRQELPYGEGAMKVLSYLLEGTSWLGGMLFLLFLQGVAQAFHAPARANHALVYLLVSLVVGGLFIAFRIAVAGGSFSTLPFEVRGGVAFGVFAFLAVWFLILVGLVRGTVTRGLAR